jgi:hypothetical protein
MHSHREALQIATGLPTLGLYIVPVNLLASAAMISIADFKSKNPSDVRICRLAPFVQFQIPASQKWLCD